MNRSIHRVWHWIRGSFSAEERYTLTRRGRTLRVQLVDLLRASPQTIEQVQAQMFEVQSRTYAAARHGDTASHDASARVAGYIANSLDTDVYGHFNTAVLFFDGETPVGSVHAYVGLREVERGRVEIIHVPSNVRAEFQSLGLLATGFIQCALRYARHNLIARHPRFNLQLCMSPVMYYFTHRRTRCVHPSPRDNVPDSMKALYRELCPEVAPAGAAVADQVGSRLEGATRDWVATSDDPAIAFYLAKNPRFEDGYGLPVLVRLRTSDFIYALTTSMKLAARKYRARLPWRGRRANPRPHPDELHAEPRTEEGPPHVRPTKP